MREQRIALKHHVDRSPMRRHRRHLDAVEHDAAGVRSLEAGDQPQQGGLAAARRAEQREELAVMNVEGKPVDRCRVAEALGEALNAQQHACGTLG
jgi:hypothetical protein